jgi:hypothetical protein
MASPKTTITDFTTPCLAYRWRQNMPSKGSSGDINEHSREENHFVDPSGQGFLGGMSFVHIILRVISLTCLLILLTSPAYCIGSGTSVK